MAAMNGSHGDFEKLQYTVFQSLEVAINNGYNH